MKYYLNRPLLLLISMFLLASCQNKDSKGSYFVEHHKDANGFSYETVANDPTGLRLYTLDNGLKVYLSKNMDEPKIQTYVAVRAGSSYDPKESTGLAHYLEHMLFKGTDSIGTKDWATEKVYLDSISALYELHRAASDEQAKKAIYRKIDSLSYIASQYAIANELDKMTLSIGATGTNAHTWYEETVYHNKIPSNELDKFLLLEGKRFNKLVLRLFHTELESVYEEFNRVQDSDSNKSFYAMMDGLFPTHPYGQQTTIGKAVHLKNPSMVDIHDYFEKYYVPNNMALVLVGDLEFEETILSVNKRLGELKGKPVTHPELPEEKPIRGVVSKEVFGPNAESIELAFRTGGVGSEDQKYITLIDMLLSNSNAGLFDLNLNQQQKVLGAMSSTTFYNDYGYLKFSGQPKGGQTLEEVKDLMLGQLELIKKGEFEDWMIQAVINDLKLQRIKQYESSTSLASMYYQAFIDRNDWISHLSFMDELSNISKVELMEFANAFFKENYVVVYKRQGKNPDVVKVENPGITPIQIDNTSKSEFMVAFNKIKSDPLKPVFVDYKSAIKSLELDQGIEMSYIKNETNDLFNLNIIFDMGKDNDKILPLAVGYLEYLGTSKYSAQELKKEFYKLGISYAVSAGYDRSYISISGLQENLSKGLELLEHLLSDPVVDQQAYDDFVSRILKSRENRKVNKDNILWTGLFNYAIYGEDSRLRNISTGEQLRNVDPKVLTEKIKDLRNYRHRVFYYGKDEKEAKMALEAHHQVPSVFKEYPVAQKFTQKETGGKVYFTDFDMVQSEMIFVGKGDSFDPGKMAHANVFNSYFGGSMSSVVFQEIRESKSLAYAAYAGFESAGKKENSDISYAYLGTQANKLKDAVAAMDGLLNEMPEVEQKFLEAKEAALKQIAAQRITKSSIFWNYERLKKRGIDHDIREDIYRDIASMTMDDLVSFFNDNIKQQDYSLVVIGNKSDMDFNVLKNYGKVEELAVDYLFNYSDEKVKP